MRFGLEQMGPGGTGTRALMPRSSKGYRRTAPNPPAPAPTARADFDFRSLSFWRRFRIRAIAFVIWALFVAWNRTFRITHIGGWKRHPKRGEGPTIYATWHGEMFALPYPFRHYHAVVMVSQSEDGEIGARVIGHMGWGAVRGSSRRGGAEVLAATESAMREGWGVAITVDGPRGPRGEVKPGAIVLASRLRSPIVPVATRSRWTRSFSRSWDQFGLPLPFSRVVVVFGDPIRVPKNVGHREFEAVRKRVGDVMNTLGVEADRYLVDTHTWAGMPLYVLYQTLGFLRAALAAPFALLGSATSSAWRRNLRERVGASPPFREEVAPLWIHCASVGEVLATGPLLEKIRRRAPHLRIVFSTGTTAAREAAARTFPQLEGVFLFPLDLAPIARRALRRVQPRAVFLSGTEIPPAFLREAERLGIPVGIVRGRISEHSMGWYRWIRPLLYPRVRGLEFASVHSERDRERFVTLGAPPDRTWVAGKSEPEKVLAITLQNLRRHKGGEKAG